MTKLNDQVIVWNRRTRTAITVRKAWTRLKGFILGQGFAVENPTWQGPVIRFHGGVDDNGKPMESTSLWGCRICAAMVPEYNRAYHERWHIAGSI
jgi:hypothetical protein